MPQVILDISELQRIKRQSPRKAQMVVRKLAMDMEGDVKSNFASTSPSPAGGPPGVDTGNLKNSIRAVPGGDAWTWLVNVGADYGVHLEYGTVKMAARPFVLPSFRRIVRNIPASLLKEVVE